MRKAIILLVIFAIFPGSAYSSSAAAGVESGVVTGGKVDVYQSVEVTVNGVTEKQESNRPGKLELKMEQKASASPVVTLTREPIASSSSPQAPVENTGSQTYSNPGSVASVSWVSLVTSMVSRLMDTLQSFFNL